MGSLLQPAYCSRLPPVLGDARLEQLLSEVCGYSILPDRPLVHAYIHCHILIADTEEENFVEGGRLLFRRRAGLLHRCRPRKG